MSDDWKWARLADHIDLTTGFPFQSATYTEDPLDTRLLRGDNIGQGVLRWSGAKRWSAEDAPSFAEYLLQAGDVVLAMDRPWIEAGLKFAAISEQDLPCLLVQRVARLRGIDGLETGFLRYLIASREFTNHVLSVQTGTAVPHISASQIGEFEFKLPPLEEQGRIASVLGALDDKIELNRRMNETLEGIARAIFTSWFVDFDPVRAKMEGRQPHGMAAETSALFPNSLVTSNLGQSPKGWDVVPLPEILEINPTRALSKGSDAVYLDMANVPIERARISRYAKRPFTSGTRFMNGDVLLARITPSLENGKTAWADFLRDGEIGWGSTEFIVLRSRPPIPTEYAYFLARTEDLRAHAIANMTGSSGRQRVPASCFDSFEAIRPADEVTRRFGELVKPVMNSLKSHDQESSILSELRDFLLPKLIAGEIRIRDAEQMAEMAL